MIVLVFLLMSLLVINCLTIHHRPSAGLLSNEVLSWRPEFATHLTDPGDGIQAPRGQGSLKGPRRGRRPT